MKGLHEQIARSHAKLQCGQVWCTRCGATRHVDPVACLRLGWPKHCGYTMTIDSPEERSDGRLHSYPLPAELEAA